ncbi:MAG: peptide deformylase [Candidatus Taylorbacteria bacterium RIFCSPHIGHO2_01_FULL_45_63]|uniref:Peptide deformylase n=1 Tax=Candidatus Taylorbacteria bacterium RIFCSPHIGHO2_02_FULL_45_35 TaxID=1802311 RepID=A0A1G2MW18_9BACT|nr:MAG: peptide deformylase [Candidatus Taylorbacteria bacterium RIFCSPHIGHO2_01_FULL_45_63]OHA28057.1 MAG: peptide deformylase [Candidatus Taylorbacteria bacterium RIFCSPHIGHO2_02_FULL_45_35]OHA34882.1 MAG: peptide deformylase [Candidatus Taylorbacteria bacterium RIFCSPLOWO2_01_FULL_45_34b]
MREIVQKTNPILRKKAKEVSKKDILSPKIQKVIAEMKEALGSQDDGVAIAAPQIGVASRIFVVSGKILARGKNKIKVETEDAETPPEPDGVFINPTITKLSKKETLMEEGCLSVRWLYGKVKRAVKTSVRATDEHGKEFTRGASGLLAQIFQHEIDHLNGVLFIDKAEDLHESLPDDLTPAI